MKRAIDDGPDLRQEIELCEAVGFSTRDMDKLDILLLAGRISDDLSRLAFIRDGAFGGPRPNPKQMSEADKAAMRQRVK